MRNGTAACWRRLLGDVSAAHTWRILRKYKIQLQRRRSWCISTDPEFGPKAADLVGIYLDHPEHALVLSVDEKPHIQALERAQGFLRLPDGKAVNGFSHCYKRHGTTTLFAALNILTGQVQTGHYPRRRRREFLDFMNGIVADHPGRMIHVVLDNLNTHKPKRDRWLQSHPNVHLHFIPTYSSWLNQVECWFSMMSRAALRGASFTSPRQLRDAIDAFVEVYNPKASPFEWTKASVPAPPGAAQRTSAAVACPLTGLLPASDHRTSTAGTARRISGLPPGQISKGRPEPAIKTGGRVQVRPHDNDFTKRYPGIVAALACLPDETVLDEEVVALDGSGKPVSSLLQDGANGQVHSGQCGVDTPRSSQHAIPAGCAPVPST